MNESSNSSDPIIKIMELLQDESPDISTFVTWYITTIKV